MYIMRLHLHLLAIQSSPPTYISYKYLSKQYQGLCTRINTRDNFIAELKAQGRLLLYVDVDSKDENKRTGEQYARIEAEVEKCSTLNAERRIQRQALGGEFARVE